MNYPNNYKILQEEWFLILRFFLFLGKYEIRFPFEVYVSFYYICGLVYCADSWKTNLFFDFYFNFPILFLLYIYPLYLLWKEICVMVLLAIGIVIMFVLLTKLLRAFLSVFYYFCFVFDFLLILIFLNENNEYYLDFESEKFIMCKCCSSMRKRHKSLLQSKKIARMIFSPRN